MATEEFENALKSEFVEDDDETIEPPPGLSRPRPRLNSGSGSSTTASEPMGKMSDTEPVSIPMPPGLASEAAKKGLSPKGPPQSSPQIVLLDAEETDVEEHEQGSHRFCVWCGKPVAPKLISARYCVYCGGVHSGEEAPPAQPFMPAALPFNDAPFRDVAQWSSGGMEKVLLLSELMQAWQGAEYGGTIYQDPSFWYGEQTDAVDIPCASYPDGFLDWQGETSDVALFSASHDFKTIGTLDIKPQIA